MRPQVNTLDSGHNEMAWSNGRRLSRSLAWLTLLWSRPATTHDTRTIQWRHTAGWLLTLKVTKQQRDQGYGFPRDQPAPSHSRAASRPEPYLGNSRQITGPDAPSISGWQQPILVMPAIGSHQSSPAKSQARLGVGKAPARHPLTRSPHTSSSPRTRLQLTPICPQLGCGGAMRDRREGHD